MTRAEFLKLYKEKLEMVEGLRLSDEEIFKVYSAFVDSVIEVVGLRGERLHLDGLGVFNIKTTKERKGRNFRTGEIITIPPKAKVVFEPSKFFKKVVEGQSLQPVNKTYLKATEKIG